MNYLLYIIQHRCCTCQHRGPCYTSNFGQIQNVTPMDKSQDSQIGKENSEHVKANSTAGDKPLMSQSIISVHLPKLNSFTDPKGIQEKPKRKRRFQKVGIEPR